MDNLETLRILLSEKEERERHSKAILALTDNFPQQRDVLLNDDPLLAVRCSRRAGKSFGAGLKIMRTAYENPGCDIIYVMHSLSQARHVMFRKILMAIDHKLELGCNFNKKDLEVTVPNGSIIRLIGLDKDDAQANKVLGNKLKLVVVDEAAFYTQDLKSMVDDVFLPALADENGQLLLISSANRHRAAGYFYDITERKDSDPAKEIGFTVIRWRWQDNPYMRTKVEAQIERLCVSNPNYKQSRSYRVQWNDEWIADDSSLVYKYVAAVNDAQRLPEGLKFHFMTVTDLGYKDPTAITICAWALGHPIFYVVKARKYGEADITLVATLLKKEIAQWNPQLNLIDAANLQSVKEISNRHNIALTPAPKWGVAGMNARVKTDFIELANDDLTSGRVKILPDAECLKVELLALPWDHAELQKGNKVEASHRDNHSADTFLYGWKRAYNWITSMQAPEAYTPEQIIRNSIRKGLEQERVNKKRGFWERDFRTKRGFQKGDFLQ